jgi:hypothetical protein
MSIDWYTYKDEDIDELAECWFVECEHNDESIQKYRNIMTQLYETAHDEFMWLFINRALMVAHKDSDLGQLAAGPLEVFLPKYGKNWIVQIETLAKKHNRFARLLTGTWQTTTPDYIWHRIITIQESVHDPLPW